MTPRDQVLAAAFLRILRAAAGMRQFDAAPRMGIVCDTLSQAENGDVSRRTLEKACEFYGVSVGLADDFLAGRVGWPRIRPVAGAGARRRGGGRMNPADIITVETWIDRVIVALWVLVALAVVRSVLNAGTRRYMEGQPAWVWHDRVPPWRRWLYGKRGWMG